MQIKDSFLIKDLTIQNINSLNHSFNSQQNAEKLIKFKIPIQFKVNNIILQNFRHSIRFKIMGQRQAPQIKQQVTLQQVEESIQTIFSDTQVKFLSSVISLPIARILQNLEENIPAQKTETGFVLNLKMIKIFYHTKFLFAMGKMINILMDKLEEIMQKNVMMIQKEEWVFCANLANFIVFFSDDKLIRMMETVSVRSDLSEQTKRFIEKLQKQGNQFEATQSLIDKFSFSEIEQIQKCLRISMNQMITMKTQVITRSQHTLKMVQKLQQGCFILYLKALYSPQHSQSIWNKAKHAQFIKSNLNIGHYFLGKGCDICKPSIYESAVLFTYNLIEKNKQNLKQFKGLPSHLFKNLPIVNYNTIYDFIMNICLFSLTYIKEGTAVYSRMSFNRIMTFKLLHMILKEVKVSSPQITYYLEEICLQTKIGMIERSFVTDLVQNYVDIVSETIENNAKRQSMKSSNKRASVTQQLGIVSKYSKQTQVSQILTKYLESGKQNYNVKYSNKKFKITTFDIITELQNDQNIMQTQFKILCEKYIYEVILNKRVMYQYNDRQIWSEILPKILEDKDMSGDQIENQDNNGGMQRQNPNVIGEQNVLSQVFTPNRQGKITTPPKKNQSELNREKIERCETQQLGIYNLRTQQSKEIPYNNIQNKIIMVSENLNMDKSHQEAKKSDHNDQDNISEEEKPEQEDNSQDIQSDKQKEYTNDQNDIQKNEIQNEPNEEETQN